jgi:hypothetical protein
MANRTAQRKIIAEAERRGEMDDLVWFPNMILPRALRLRPDAAEMAATYPPGWVPVIGLAPDRKEADEKAKFLWEILCAANEGRGIVFETILTSRSYMRELGLRFYEWGEPLVAVVDWVCPLCGSVQQVMAGQKGECCVQVYRPIRPKPRMEYRLPENADFYGRNWWGGGEASADEQWINVRHSSPFTGGGE